MGPCDSKAILVYISEFKSSQDYIIWSCLKKQKQQHHSLCSSSISNSPRMPGLIYRTRGLESRLPLKIVNIHWCKKSLSNVDSSGEYKIQLDRHHVCCVVKIQGPQRIKDHVCFILLSYCLWTHKCTKHRLTLRCSYKGVLLGLLGASYFLGHRTREHVWIPDLAISAEEQGGTTFLVMLL